MPQAYGAVLFSYTEVSPKVVCAHINVFPSLPNPYIMNTP